MSGSRNSRKKKTCRTIKACDSCPALCCRDLVMVTEKPKTAGDVNELRWQVRFDTVNVFIRSHKWYLLVKGRCMYLGKDNLCRIYPRRPRRCRDHKPRDCERYGKFYDVLLSTPEELDQYLAEKGILRKVGLRPAARGR
jgi:Fe-S-cluster containining protein